MKATISRDDLNRGLSLVGRVVAAKGQLPVLANVLIEAESDGVVVSATNLEIGIRVGVGGKVDEKGALTVPAKVLGEFIAASAGENVVITDHEAKLLVVSGQFKANFAGISATEFPVMPRLGSNKTSKKISGIKKAVIEEIAVQVAYAAAADESRPVLTGVQLKDTGSGLIAVATDGFRMSKKIVTTEKGQFEGLIIPARTILELSRIIGEGRKGEIETEVVAENNQVVFGYDGVELISRILEGNFPDVDRIVPKETKTEVVVDRMELQRAVKAGAIFAREGANLVKLQVSDGELELMAASSGAGDGSIKLVAEKEGEDVLIAFNHKYLSDFLGSIQDERVVIKMNGGLAAGIFLGEKDETIMHLIMPVRI